MAAGIGSNSRSHKLDVTCAFTDRKLPPLTVSDKLLDFWRKAPLNKTCRIACYHSKIRHIFGYNAAGTYYSAKTDAPATGCDDDRVADPGIMLNDQLSKRNIRFAHILQLTVKEKTVGGQSINRVTGLKSPHLGSDRDISPDPRAVAKVSGFETRSITVGTNRYTIVFTHDLSCRETEENAFVF